MCCYLHYRWENLLFQYVYILIVSGTLFYFAIHTNVHSSYFIQSKHLFEVCTTVYYNKKRQQPTNTQLNSWFSLLGSSLGIFTVYFLSFFTGATSSQRYKTAREKCRASTCNISKSEKGIPKKFCHATTLFFLGRHDLEGESHTSLMEYKYDLQNTT